MLMAKPVGCQYTYCFNNATHKHQNLNCFAFCDDHWPGFLAVLNRGTQPLNSSLRDEGLRLLQDGMSPQMVSKRLGVSESSVHVWRKEAEIVQFGSGKVSEAEIAEGLRLRSMGLTWKQVAERLGRHEKTVQKRIASRSWKPGRYEDFFRRVLESGECLEFPQSSRDPRSVTANINRGLMRGAPAGSVRARTVKGRVWVEAVPS